jgi:uncharacterized protein (DUF983 family)
MAKAKRSPRLGLIEYLKQQTAKQSSSAAKIPKCPHCGEATLQTLIAGGSVRCGACGTQRPA